MRIAHRTQNLKHGAYNDNNNSSIRVGRGAEEDGNEDDGQNKKKKKITKRNNERESPPPPCEAYARHEGHRRRVACRNPLARAHEPRERDPGAELTAVSSRPHSCTADANEPATDTRGGRGI